MAEVISKRSIVYDITFESGNAEKGAKDIGTAMGKAEKEIDKATTAVNEFADKTLSAGARLRQIKNELNNFKGTEAQFRKLTFEAAQLTDQIQKTNQRIAILASSTRNIQALASAFSGLTGVFTAVQGATALFGKESESVQRALVKLQGSLALLQGVQAAVATVTEQSAAKTVILNNVQKLYTFITNGATAATKALRAALISTVVGAVIVGIAALVAYWDDLKTIIAGASKESERFAKAEVSRLDFQIEKAKLLGKSTDELREKQLDAQLQLANAQKDEEKQVEILNQKKLLAIELEKRKAKEGFEEKKRIKQLEIELAEDGSAEQLALQIQLIDIERSIRTSGEKITQEELILILQVAEEKKHKLRMEFLLKQRKAAEDLVNTMKGIDTILPKELMPSAQREIKELTDELYLFAKAWDEVTNSTSNWIELADGTMIKGTIPNVQGGLKATSTLWAENASNVALYTGALASSMNSLAGIAKEGSAAQIALSEISILASYAQSIASAIAGATASGAATGPAALFTTPTFIASLVASTVAAFAASFTTLQKAKALQSSSGAVNAVAFAEGEVDIHRSGETRGKDSIPAVIMPGESVIRTDRTSQYKPELQAIQAGNLEELIRVNYVEPALAMQALDSSVSGAAAPDYSDRLYRQYLLTGEGNMSSKRMVRYLASIDKKLTPTDKRYSR